MAQDKIFNIKIGGVKESITNLESLENVLASLESKVKNINDKGGFSMANKESTKAMDELAKLTQKITQYDEEYQRAVEASKGVLKDKNQVVKQAIELEKANIVVEENAKSTYYEKQKLLTALGKQIKSMSVDTEENKKKQQELIAKYSALNKELKDFDASLGNHQRNVGDYARATKNLKTELKDLQIEMASMIDNGISKADPKFLELAHKAGKFKDALNDAGEEVKRFASDTKKLDDVINIAESATAAFQLYKGAMSAFGLETEATEEAIQKLAGAMSIIQSLKTLQETLESGSATAQLFHKALQALGIESKAAATSVDTMAASERAATLATDTLTLSTKALKLALASLGIGLVLIAVGELIEHWEDLCNWFDNTIPLAKSVGGVFNWLKAVAYGLGKSIIDWLVNPLKTFADVIGKLLQGDFEGAFKSAINGIGRQATVAYTSWREGYENQVKRGLGEITKKAAEEQAKQTKYELDMLKARRGNQAKYSKEGIALQKKEFEERRKAAQGNLDELRKIDVEEANFFRECEEAKVAAAKRGADERIKINKNVADDDRRAYEEELRRQQELFEFKIRADKKLYKSTADYLIAQKNMEIELAKENVELYKNGPLEKYIEAVTILNEKLAELFILQRQGKLYDFFDDFRTNIDSTADSIDEFIEGLNNIVKKAQEYGKVVSTSLFAEFAKENKIFENLTEDQFKYLYGIYIEYVKDGLRNEEQLRNETNKKIAEQTISINKRLIDNINAQLNGLTSDQDSHKGASVYQRLFKKEDAKKAYQDYIDYWKDVLEATKQKIPILIETWDNYLESIKTLYGEDSKEYLDAIEQKKKALRELLELQEKAERGASGKRVSSKNGRLESPSPINPKESTKNADGSTNWDALWDSEKTVIDNLLLHFDMVNDMFLSTAMDTLSMYMDFAIEETAQKLEQVEELHDKALDKVNESAEKIQELNDSLKDSGNTNLEATKEQLADEQLLYAQRLAEEKKLAEQERALKNKQAQQEANARKMELRYQMVMAIANTAQGASKALATWGWPLGSIFAGIMQALGAVQVALIAKQISAIKPVKYANGGLLTGPSHAQGGIPVGNTGIEVEGQEYVVNKKSTSKYFDVLRRINDNDPSVRYLQGSNRREFADASIRKFANGGQLNFERADANLQANISINKLMGAINGIDLHPVVAVNDIWKAENRLVTVRGLAGRE